jgi:hypothetical protein
MPHHEMAMIYAMLTLVKNQRGKGKSAISRPEKKPSVKKQDKTEGIPSNRAGENRKQFGE